MKIKILNDIIKYMNTMDYFNVDVNLDGTIDFENYEMSMDALEQLLNEIKTVLDNINVKNISSWKIYNFGCDDIYTIFLFDENGKYVDNITWDFDFKIIPLGNKNDCEFCNWDVCNDCPRKLYYDFIK